MKKTTIYILLSMAALFLSGRMLGQENETEKENLAIRGSLGDRYIRLRWAPTNSKAWMEGKKYGYVLEKITIRKNGQLQTEGGIEKIDQSFLPAPLSGWEQAAGTSDYAAVIAQAFYGDKFQTSMQTHSYADIINQSSELEQRFFLSVSAAQYDYRAATLAGWAWSDSAIRKDETYLYRIYLNKSQPEKGDTAVIVLAWEDRKDLPKPLRFNALPGDKKVFLSWNYLYQSDLYHAYSIERAAQGALFQAITDKPLSLMSDNMQEMIYVDSLPDNTQTYTYRIRGITAFDETGPYSDELSVKGQEPVTCLPHIVYGECIDANRARLAWSLECEHPEQIKKLEIKRSAAIDGPYASVMNNISPTQREIVFNLPEAQNYLQLYAYSQSGEERSSFPFLLRRVDSIPPAVPRGLNVYIDSLAIARLSWEPNREEDVRGYRILRSFTETGEKSSITPQLLTLNEYTDTLSPALANEAVYYAITAVDTYYNESQACKTEKALKPNRLTPVEPVITGYDVSDKGLRISWMTDDKAPAVQYELIRKKASENAPAGEVVFSGNYKTRTCTDQPDEAGLYIYQVCARGADPAKTAFSSEVKVEIRKKEALHALSNFACYKDERNNRIELSWSKHPHALTYRLYKEESGKPAVLLKELDADRNSYIDEQLTLETTYTYHIYFRSAKGENSKTKSITINY